MLALLKFLKIAVLFFIATQAINTCARETKTLQALVVHITDGDTIRVRPLDSNKKSDSLRIRIDGIDAPEICQPYGMQSAAALKKLLASKLVTVSSKRFDDYGRDIAKVTVDNIDVASWMVKNGHAWSNHYRYSDGQYGAEEKMAMRQKIGLFAYASAVEPKVFRRQHGSCYLATKNDRKRYK